MKRLVLSLFGALKIGMHLRLPWQRNPKGGYIAHPEGVGFPRRVATVHYDGVSSIKWAWLVRWEDAVESGHKPSKQEAANEATARWPVVVRNGMALAAERAEREKLEADVRRVMAGGGDVPIEHFEIGTADSARLVRILDLVKAGGGLGGPAKGLVDACSAELFRRRTG
jgi:hypothetical protein